MGTLQKAFALIGGLIIGIGITYLVNGIYPLEQDIMILLGIVLTISAGSSLYFMTKSAGG